MPRFVLKWCERGKGLKPDWATKGIEFLCFAADPKVTNFLSNEKFMVIQVKMIYVMQKKELFRNSKA